jgi:CBS domain-containing protein
LQGKEDSTACRLSISKEKERWNTLPTLTLNKGTLPYKNLITMSHKSHEMKVEDYMTCNPITVQRDVSAPDAITIMATKGIGNLVVTEDLTGPVGILTERELIEYLSLNGRIPNLPLKDVLGYQSFNSITPDYSILAAANIMISEKARLLVFNADNTLVGIITASDMVRAFSKTEDNPSLEHTMNKKIFDLKFTDTVLGAIKLMDTERIGSVIINDQKKPYGIFTERDLLTRILLKNVDLESKVGRHCSTPLIMAPISTRGKKAAEIMTSKKIKRLPLTDEGGPMAMVTARDLVEAFGIGASSDITS